LLERVDVPAPKTAAVEADEVAVERREALARRAADHDVNPRERFDVFDAARL